MPEMDNELLHLLTGTTHRSKQAIIHSAFSYPGSKRKSLDHILPELPYLGTFVEVCGGSGVITLNRKPEKLMVFNDINSGVTAFYRCMRDPKMMKALMEWLDLTVHSREEFVWCRDHWKDHKDDVERAARWYYMHSYSFGALERNFGRCVGEKGTFAGKVRDRILGFPAIHARFRKVQVENLDMFQCMQDYDSVSTVHYVDPPYLPGTVNPGVYTHELSRDQHKRMCRLIGSLKGFVALSGYQNDLYDSFDFWTDKIEWQSHVSMKSSAVNDPSNQWGEERNLLENRRAATEVLWIKS
jgi:DNA adenine methylase